MRLLPLVLSTAAALAALPAAAATINAASCAQAAVQTAVNAAVDGDTVLVPAGTCTWSAGVNVKDKTIVLQGAGSGNGGTKIVHSGGAFTLLSVNAGTKTGRMDISGFWFSGAASTWNGVALEAWGPTGWKKLRIHHNTFDGNHPWSAKIGANTHGLLDNNLFKGKAYGIVLYGNGAGDWATPLQFGTADFFFVEDNTFDFDDFYGSTGVPVADMYSGGRQVFRRNTIKHGMWETHDKARSGLVSANAYEVYDNTFSAVTNKWKALDIASGTGVVYNNTISGDYTVPIGAIDYKTFQPGTYVQRCDGTDPADQNTAGHAGWRCQYQIGTHGEGASAVSVPLVLWNNRANGALTDMKCTDGCTHVQAGRDFINNGTTAKPGYTPYAYPHPLRSEAGAPADAPPVAALAAPTNLVAK